MSESDKSLSAPVIMICLLIRVDRNLPAMPTKMDPSDSLRHLPQLWRSQSAWPSIYFLAILSTRFMF